MDGTYESVGDTVVAPLRRQPSPAKSSKDSWVELGPRRRVGLVTLLPAFVIFICCISLPVALLAYLLAHRVTSASPDDAALFAGAIVAVEGVKDAVYSPNSNDAIEQSTLYGLAVTSIISHLISLTVPPLMGLLAFRVAAHWIQGGICAVGEERKSNTFTPVQFGLLLKIYGSSSIFSLIQSGRYLYRERRTSAKRSPIMWSFILLAVVLLISHAVGFCDLWLHTVSGTVLCTSLVPVDDISSMKYSTAINSSICPYPGYQQNVMGPGSAENLTGENCLAYYNFVYGFAPSGPGWGVAYDPNVVAESVATSNNMSSSYTVIIAEPHEIAVFVPASISSTGLHNFSANSFGLSASCTLPKCGNIDTGPPESTDGGPFACNDFSPPYNATLYDSTTFLYDPNGFVQQPDWSNGTGSNPFGFFIQMMFALPAMGLQTSGLNASSSVGSPGWYYSPAQENVAYLTTCTISIYNVTLAYSNNTYSVSDATLADFNTTSAFSAGFIDYMSGEYLIPQLLNILQGEIQSPGFATLLQSQLMLRSLALSAGLVQPSSVNSAYGVTQEIASRYPIAPLVTFLALLFLYGGVALAIILWTSFSVAESLIVCHTDDRKQSHNALTLAQARLTDPLAVLADVFRWGDSSDDEDSEADEDWRSFQSDSLEMFGPERGKAEVSFGLDPMSPGLRVGLVRRRIASGLDADSEAERARQSTDS
ncbi:uncharacterized protein FIBRA_04819 [Fibroporia radiculosa]|uniref:Uncharacterized protein n=1 Tax=Fibroporia radiculosa TaxID=599839 RepID=J4G805_9APHY|nr:uncharacterized protein FIBRA_04819 [Fibroporia radiculosa]CCM02713.1 predicted protein [Fibroporia radiculosa]